MAIAKYWYAVFFRRFPALTSFEQDNFPMQAQARSAGRSSSNDLQQLLAEVRHELAERLETVAVVSKQLAELCDQAEAHLNASETALPESDTPTPPAPLSDSLRNSQQQLVSATLREVFGKIEHLRSTPDWWQSLEQGLAEQAKK